MAVLVGLVLLAAVCGFAWWWGAGTWRRRLARAAFALAVLMVISEYGMTAQDRSAPLADGATVAAFALGAGLLITRRRP